MNTLGVDIGYSDSPVAELTGERQRMDLRAKKSMARSYQFVVVVVLSTSYSLDTFGIYESFCVFSVTIKISSIIYKDLFLMITRMLEISANFC